MWVDWGCRDIGGSVGGWIACGTCREGFIPEGRDDGYDTLDGSRRWLGYFKKEHFVVDQFWVGRGVWCEEVIDSKAGLIRWFGVKFM